MLPALRDYGSAMAHFLFSSRRVIFLLQRNQGSSNLAVNLDCALLADVMIPESPEAYVKLTENAIKNVSGRHPRRQRAIFPAPSPVPRLSAHLLDLSQLPSLGMLGTAFSSCSTQTADQAIPRIKFQ